MGADYCGRTVHVCKDTGTDDDEWRRRVTYKHLLSATRKTGFPLQLRAVFRAALFSQRQQFKLLYRHAEKLKDLMEPEKNPPQHVSQ